VAAGLQTRLSFEIAPRSSRAHVPPGLRFDAAEKLPSRSAGERCAPVAFLLSLALAALTVGLAEHAPGYRSMFDLPAGLQTAAARSRLNLQDGYDPSQRGTHMVTSRNRNRLAWMFVALCSIPLVIRADSDVSPVDTLAREVERTEAVRAVKDLQHAYSQYAQYGLWTDLGSLFTDTGEAIYGSETVKGRAAIVDYNMTKFGGGKPGLPPGVVNSHFVEVPLVNLSVDGNSAKARWYGLSMLGGGATARWDSGTFENEYVKDNGVWKIARLRYYPQFGGPVESGWQAYANPLPLVAYHFKSEDEAGTPIPPAVGPAPKTTATLASLEQRIDALNAQDKARNLQNAYGYYVDRKMWDDVIDLFTSDGVLEISGAGVYEGAANIRRGLERDGPAGITYGQLNDHPLFDTMIEIAPGGMEARVRGLDLGMIGDFNSGKAFWSVSVFANRFVKQDGVWKIREMRVYPLVKADYGKNWTAGTVTAIPAFLPNPVTGKAVTYPAGLAVVANDRLRPAPPAATPAASSASVDGRIKEAERKLAMSKAYDGAVNITGAYTHYIDDGQWTSMGAIFARHGNKHVPFNGYYIGPERIAHRPGARPAANSTSPGRGGWHWLLQPVIHVADDGRSAKMRTRLFHPGTGFNPGGGIEGGMYPNNQAVLENGVWKLWSLTIDEPYFSAPFPYGWAKAAPPRQPAAAPRPAAAATTTTPALPAIPGSVIYPPNVPQALLGRRMEKFVGGTGEAVRWPGILNMWFHYKNPVSGRVPEFYWPDCGVCEFAPYLSMDKYGYTLPPS
jgi:hypothetical protein